MAKPRVFVSSTFYDLRYVREDIDRFLKEIGYEPVRHETGGVPYGKEKPLEDYAYKEVERCDIIVCIIGGRFGTESTDRSGTSITQKELLRAIERGIQVFIFVEKGVANEYQTYILNKENTDIKYRHVDDVRVYKFIEELYTLPSNNPITPFESSKDIIDFLRTQFAGLFQRFLAEQQRISEINVLGEMKSIASTLQQLVKFLTEERENKDEAIRQIILSNHPAFRRFAKITNTRYRIFFTNKQELDAWLKARRFTPVSYENLDPDSIYEWESEEGYIKITEDIFDNNGALKPYTEQQWNDNWIQFIEKPQNISDDELPF